MPRVQLSHDWLQIAIGSGVVPIKVIDGPVQYVDSAVEPISGDMLVIKDILEDEAVLQLLAGCWMRATVPGSFAVVEFEVEIFPTADAVIAVGGSIANVNTVGNNIAAVNTAADNMAAIIAAPGHASASASSAALSQAWATGTNPDGLGSLSAREEADRAEEARDVALGAVPNVFPPTRTALKALNTATVTAAYLKEAGREGQFIWRTGDYSAEVAADTAEGIYIKADDIATTGGAWVRGGGWNVEGADVRWFGVKADSDGTTGSGTDDTVAMQVVYDRGGFYRLPEGVIRLTATLTAKQPITFVGVGCVPFTALVETAANVRGPGSWFFFDHLLWGVVTVGIDAGLGLSGVSKHRYLRCGSLRDQPVPGAGSFTPLAAEWDFIFNDCEFEFDDFVPLNPTRFLACGLDRGGRARINNVRGQPLLQGISINGAFDLVEIDAHFWPFWSLNTNVKEYTWANLQSLITNRVDGLVLKKFFTIFANIGWLITSSGDGVLNRAHGDLVYLDNCDRCMVFNPGADGNTISINHLVAYGRIDSSTSRGIQFSSDNNRLQVGFLDCEGFYNQAAYIAGTGNRMEVGRARFKNYDFAGLGANGLVVDAGNRLIFNGPVENLPSASQNLFAGAGRIDGPNVWRSFSPTVSATSGTITTVGATSMHWRAIGNLVEIMFSITITNNGTGSGALRFTLPVSAALDAVGAFRNVDSGNAGVAVVAAGGSVCDLYRYDNSYPMATGQKVIGSISYRTQ